MSVESLITQHIDIWTSAVQTKSSAGRGTSSKLDLYGIKKLRELILELAVHGKLVPQDPNDEPASVLLERIAEEMEQLSIERKVKKPKALHEIKAEEKQFELPSGWEWSFNISLFCLVKGKKPKVLSENNIGFPYLDIEALDRGNILRYTDDTNCPMSSNKDIVVVCDGSRSGLILNGQNGVIGSTLAIINTPRCIQNYIKLYFQQSYEKLNSSMKGAAIPHLDTKALRNGVMAIPPLSEQHRIVAKVDELMTLCNQLEQKTEASIAAHQVLVETLLATLTNSKNAEELLENWGRISAHFDTLFTTEVSINQLKQTILQLAVMGRLMPFGSNTKKGGLKKFLSFGPRNGFSPKEVQSDTGVKVLKLGATSYGSLDLNESKSIDVEIARESHLWLNKGDILIQRGNSANYVGCNCLVEEDVSGVIYPDLMMKIRPSEIASSEFLSMWLSSPMAREFMWSRMTGTSGTMPKISKKVVESIPVVLPSLQTQGRIVAKVNELLSICEQLKQSLFGIQQTQLQLTDTIVEEFVDTSAQKTNMPKDKSSEMMISTILSTTKVSPDNSSPIALLVTQEGGKADAKEIWTKTRLSLPDFYKQLKKEIEAGYIEMPSPAVISK